MISLIAEIHLFSIPLNSKVLNNPDPGLVIWVLTITLRKRHSNLNGLWLPGPLAQSVEQRTFNPWVVGSIPTGPTPVNSHQIKEPTNVFKSHLRNLQEGHLVWLRRAHRRSARRRGRSRPLLLLTQFAPGIKPAPSPIPAFWAKIGLEHGFHANIWVGNLQKFFSPEHNIWPPGVSY
jgi:hypothetical protein